MDIQSEYTVISAMVRLSHENETLLHQQSLKGATKMAQP